MTQQHIEFDTTEYEFSHGKKPSGRGSWAFCPYDKARGNDYLDHTKFFPVSTFAEAKKAARVFFAGKTDFLTVCS